MEYISTRGSATSPGTASGFADVFLSGLARDGGLYVPTEWPQWSADDIASLAGRPYGECATRIMAPFVAPDISESELAELVGKACSAFPGGEVAPLKQIAGNDWLLELFHGPTLAFKDVALQLVGHLFEHVLTARGERITVLGATSGDTGSAAIDALQGRDCAEVFMLHPEGKVTEVQRRQMTTIDAPNVHNIAVKGSFDDCQAMVKAAFNDLAFRDATGLSAVNSINWARVMAQTVYYFTSAVALGAPAREISYAVPTGNFGDAYAGFVARNMGLGIRRMVIATNENDIVTRALIDGEYRLGDIHHTISPSMDIQLSSNFERLLFDLYDRDGGEIKRLMDELQASGGFVIGDGPLAKAREIFAGCSVSEDETRATMAALFQKHNMVIDPHTAIGVHAARNRRGDPDEPMVVLSTAHPAKFPDVVREVTGETPALPGHLADIYERQEQFDVLENDIGALKSFIQDRAKG